MKILAALVLCAVALYGATRLLTTQMTGSPSQSGTVVVAQPNGQLAQYTVSGMTMNNSAGILSVNQAPANVSVAKSVLTAQTSTFSQPAQSCKVLLVYWNGLLMSTPDDYSVASTATPASPSTVTFAGAIPGPGDIVQQVCFQ